MVFKFLKLYLVLFYIFINLYFIYSFIISIFFLFTINTILLTKIYILYIFDFPMNQAAHKKLNIIQ
jgi:hypothetical protein